MKHRLAAASPPLTAAIGYDATMLTASGSSISCTSFAGGRRMRNIDTAALGLTQGNLRQDVAVVSFLRNDIARHARDQVLTKLGRVVAHGADQVPAHQRPAGTSASSQHDLEALVAEISRWRPRPGVKPGDCWLWSNSRTRATGAGG